MVWYGNGIVVQYRLIINWMCALLLAHLGIFYIQSVRYFKLLLKLFKHPIALISFVKFLFVISKLLSKFVKLLRKPIKEIRFKAQFTREMFVAN